MNRQTIIYLLLILIIICVYKNDLINLLNIKKSNEPFFDVRSELIQALADKLLISPNRILNFRYTGDLETNKLTVNFGINSRNIKEVNEPSNSELLETINHLFDTNTFAIIYQERIINLSSNGTVSSHSDSSAHNNKDGFQSVNNVKPREDFEQYYCNVDTRFDNTNLLKTKNLVDAGYRNFPYDDSLTRFISIDTENGKMQAINNPSSCPS